MLLNPRRVVPGNDQKSLGPGKAVPFHLALGWDVKACLPDFLQGISMLFKESTWHLTGLLVAPQDQ